MEEFLAKAKIIESKKIGEGVTKPRKLVLKRNGFQAAGVWKSPSGIGGGTIDKWEHEVAAYRLDKLLDLNMVPCTVKRRFMGTLGSLQLWMTLEMSELERVKENIPVPPEKEDHWNKMIYLQRAFDSLIANRDRTLQNLRYTKDWSIILIDHSLAFSASPTFTERLLYGQNGIRREKPIEKLPRTFVAKLRTLTAKTIREAVEYFLTSEEIKAVMVRKELLVREIDEMIKEKGETAVLY